MFHITPSKNLTSILTHGIIPNYRKGLTCSELKLSCVWLTNCPALILTEQAGSNWVQKQQPVIIEIDCTGLQVLPAEYNWCEPPMFSRFEFVFYGIIVPKRIVSTTVI